MGLGTNSRRVRIRDKIVTATKSLRVRLFAGVFIVTLATTLIAAVLATYSVGERFESFVIEKDEDLDAFVRNSSSNLRSGLVVEVYYSDPAAGRARFLESVNQALVIVVLLAGSVSIIALLWLATPGLRMIEALTQAARRMADGDMRQRVQIRTNDEIGELAVTFNDMVMNLERIEKLRRNMVTDIAHELRTPLTNLQGYMEALRDGVMSPSPELFQALHDETKHLTRLVNDLQDLTLAEAGQLKLSRQSVVLSEVVQRLLIAINAGMNKKQSGAITFDVNLPPDLPQLYADPDRVNQILRNLIDNALAHTPKGGKISISAAPVGDFVEIHVSDTGVGIPEEHLLLLFERFYRVDRSRSRETGGTGIGLAITREMVEIHGGNIRVESKVGKGTTFIFTLPTHGSVGEIRKL